MSRASEIVIFILQEFIYYSFIKESKKRIFKFFTPIVFPAKYNSPLHRSYDATKKRFDAFNIKNILCMYGRKVMNYYCYDRKRSEQENFTSIIVTRGKDMRPKAWHQERKKGRGARIEKITNRGAARRDF